MADLNDVKNYFKECTDAEARLAHAWVQAGMEMRGLIQIDGARKRRSDAGKSRIEQVQDAQRLLDSAPNAAVGK